jgi:hypothetical protein
MIFHVLLERCGAFVVTISVNSTTPPILVITTRFIIRIELVIRRIAVRLVWLLN